MSYALIDGAARAQSLASKRGLLESSFAHLFTKFVYPQIWEDPVVDIAALKLNEHSRMIAITSGGCNVMNYLTKKPRRLVAVDLNPAHLALLDLKVTAARHLAKHSDFFRFFGQASDRANVTLYDDLLADRIQPESRDFWSSRSITGRRRIDAFRTGLYRKGLLGRTLTFGHWVCRLHGADLTKLQNAHDKEALLNAYDKEVRPVFDSWMVKLLTKMPVSLFGLGIPPRQFDALKADGNGSLHQLLAERTERLLTSFPLDDNYFAHQALTHRYGRALPPYLEAGNFAIIKREAPSVEMRHAMITDVLNGEEPHALDAFVLLDAQDWMNGQQITGLWRGIDRAATTGARFIYRSGGEQAPAFNELPTSIIENWQRLDALSAELHDQDRSGVYGAFHVFEKRK